MRPFLIAIALLTVTPSASAEEFDIYRNTGRPAPTRLRAVTPGVAPAVMPLNHLFASHFYYGTTQLTRPVEIRINAWAENARPWNDAEWRRTMGITAAGTYVARVWRRRGDYVCAVQSVEVPMLPSTQFKFEANTESFAAGDWLYIEPSDAFAVSVWMDNGSGWQLMTELKTNATYDWHTPGPSPPWGDGPPHVDCRGGVDTM